jgi:hypothetical protein
MPGLFGTDWVIDPYRAFLVVALGGLGLLSIAMLAIALFLLRRNRRLPRLVKPRRRRRP